MMNTGKLFLIGLVFNFLPISRLFKLKRTLLRWAGIDINKDVRVYSNAKIYGSGIISIGKGTFIGHKVILISSYPAKIIIGENVDIAPLVFIGTGTHLIDPNGTRMAGYGISKDVIIGNGVWIGANSTILPGITIGNMSIIGAGSVVVNSIPDYSIAVGNPAKVIKVWDFETQQWRHIGSDGK